MFTSQTRLTDERQSRSQPASERCPSSLFFLPCLFSQPVVGAFFAFIGCRLFYNLLNFCHPTSLLLSRFLTHALLLNKVFLTIRLASTTFSNCTPCPRVPCFLSLHLLNFKNSEHVLFVLRPCLCSSPSTAKRVLGEVDVGQYAESFSVSLDRPSARPALIYCRRISSYSRKSDARRTEVPLEAPGAAASRSVPLPIVTQQVHVHRSPDLPALPPASDFRTSLILPEYVSMLLAGDKSLCCALTYCVKLNAAVHAAAHRNRRSC